MILEEINKTYKLRKKRSCQALSDINIEIPDKGFTLVCGPSGSGKSTLINIISGLDSNYSGNYYYNGICISKLNNEELLCFRRNNIGFVFQNNALIPNLSVKENILLPLEITDKQVDNEYFNILVKMLRIDDLLEKNSSDLSFGQQARVGIARALINNPGIVIADEPSGSLDEVNAKIIFDYLKRLSLSKCVIVVSHNIELVISYADKIVELKKGQSQKDKLYFSDTNNALSLTKNRTSLKNTIRRSKHFFQNNSKANIVNTIICSLLFSIMLIAFYLSTFNPTTTFVKNINDKRESFIVSGDEDDPNPYQKIILLDVDNFKIFDAEIELHLNDYNSVVSTASFGNICGIMEINDSLIYHENLELLFGSYPQSDNEVCIPKYLCDAYVAYGYINNGIEQSLNSYEDICKLTIEINDEEKKICGIIDTHFDEQRYKKLDDFGEFDDKVTLLRNELEVINDYSIHNLIYTYKNINAENNSEVVGVLLSFKDNKLTSKVIEFINELNLSIYSPYLVMSNFDSSILKVISNIFKIVCPIFIALIVYLLLKNQLSNINQNIKEISVLELLGMSKKEISISTLINTIAIAMLSFIIGIVMSFALTFIINEQIKGIQFIVVKTFFVSFNIIFMAFLGLILALMACYLFVIKVIKKNNPLKVIKR